MIVSFASAIRRFNYQLEGKTDKKYRKIVFQIWIDTVQGTPRDTGQLRANWQIGINRQNGDQRPASSPFPGVDESEKLRIEDTAIIFNNMEYAEVIENGRPDQDRVPHKMLANAINAAKLRRGLF